MIAHSRTGSAQAKTFAIAAHSYSSQSSHHSDPVDADDFDCSPNAVPGADVMLRIAEFRGGLRGGVWRDILNPELVTVAVIEKTSIGLVEYNGTIIGVAHVDAMGNIGAVSLNEKFMAMVDRMKGLVAA